MEEKKKDISVEDTPIEDTPVEEPKEPVSDDVFKDLLNFLGDYKKGEAEDGETLLGGVYDELVGPYRVYLDAAFELVPKIGEDLAKVISSALTVIDTVRCDEGVQDILVCWNALREIRETEKMVHKARLYNILIRAGVSDVHAVKIVFGVDVAPKKKFL